MSNRLVGFILFAFLIFITMRGDLKGYLQVVGLAPGGDVQGPAPIPDEKKSGGGGLFGSITGAVKSAGTLASLAGV